MNKDKVINMVCSHRRFFAVCSKLYNGLSPKNKLTVKGVKVFIGISAMKGLKIINYGSNNEITIGDFVRVHNSTIILRGDNNKIRINDFAYLNQTEFYMEDSGNEIIIGEHTAFCGKAHLATIEGTKICVGNHCLFSSDLHFRTGDSHSILNMEGKRINKSKDIIIDDHVWIGTKVTCLKGTHVSRDSVVAATTTLCKDYSVPNTIIAGVPGKIVKTDINWSTERIQSFL